MLSERLLARRARYGVGAGGVGDRIEVVRLSPRQTLRIFDTVRGRDPNVRGLYTDLEGEGFDLVRERARGTVMRAYAADGLRGGGIVVELPHEGPDGALAWFHVSAREGMGGGGDAVPDEVSAGYSVRHGGRVERPGR